MPPNDGEPALDVLDEEATRLGLSLTDTHRSAFRRYLELIEEHNDRAGLTAIHDRTEVVRRLFGESLALLVALRDHRLIDPGSPIRMADLGPGGGFPGLPMRIADPGLDLVLIEAQQRRCAFLELATSELDLDGVTVVNARVEEAGREEGLREGFDLVVARALAPLAVLVEYALPLLRPGGLLATPKGSRASDELTDAAAAITALGGVALEPIPLSLPADAPPQQILLVGREGALDERFPRRPGVPSKRPLR